MSDPPGSPPIKAEPQDTTNDALPSNTNEIILISDDESEVVAPAALGSPFHEPHGSEAINLGPSMLSTKPKPSVKDNFAASMGEKIRAKQIATAKRQRDRTQPVQRAPARAGRSELFITDSNPGTPDPAETFRTLQRNVEGKRQNGSLTWQEDIEFARAQDEEEARVLKERLDKAYDASNNSAIDEEESRLSPDVASMPDEDLDVEEPKKRGRKRKADPSSQAQPKKRRATAKSTEDILIKTRRKAEEKIKSARAAKGKNQAPKKQGRKKRAADPNLLNSTSIRDNDIFENAAHNRDLPDQPTFEFTTRKDKALKSLIASVPEECRPIAKVDKKYLDDAMRQFTGQGAVKPADDGNWRVKGMKATLKHYQILGVSFMRRRECATQEPKGGILADEMQAQPPSVPRFESNANVTVGAWVKRSVC